MLERQHKIAVSPDQPDGVVAVGGEWVHLVQRNYPQQWLDEGD